MRAAALGIALALAAGAHAEARGAEPFRPELYFAGATRASGVMENAFDRSTSGFTGETRGRRQPDGSTIFDQVVRFDDGSVRVRTWRIVPTGPDTIAATGTDIVGTARGDIRGRELHLLSTIRAEPGNPFSDVEFEQILTLLPDGRSVYNRSTIRKLGVIVRKARETFARVGDDRRSR